MEYVEPVTINEEIVGVEICSRSHACRQGRLQRQVMHKRVPYIIIISET
jgi:hypothetical protein